MRIFKVNKKAGVPVEPVNFSSFNFFAGEVQVRIDPIEHFDADQEVIMIEAFLRSSDDIFRLLLVTDALRRMLGEVSISVSLPYLPYGRQDRVCYPGEALSLAVIASLLNAQCYETVVLFDPHSAKAAEHIERVRIVDSLEYVRQVVRNWQAKGAQRIVLVSPDKGAREKVDRIGAALCLEVLHADKKRNPKDGQIEGMTLDRQPAEFAEACFLVVDDLCEGGRTFIELAKVIEVPKERMGLYVTHGLFSKGVEPLKPYFGEIFSLFPWNAEEEGVQRV